MLNQIRRAVVGLVLLVGGCMVGPDYEQPEIAVPGAYRQADQKQSSPATDSYAGAKQDDSSLALRAWEAIYVDPVLSELIRKAIADNLELAAVRARVQQADALLAQSRAILLPGFSLPLSYERESETRDNTEYRLVGAFAWEVDLFGFNRRQVQIAEANLLATQQRAYLQQVSLIGRVASAYFELIDITAREEITRQTVETRQNALEILRLRMDTGVISGLPVRQAEVALAEAEAALPRFVQRKLVLENTPSVLTGSPPGPLRLSATLQADLRDFFAVPADLPVGLPSELLLRRPDILIAEANLRAATALIGARQADLFPRLRLTGDYGLGSEELGNFLGSGVESWRLAGSLVQPLYQGGRLRSAVTEAESVRSEALANYQQSVLTALGEVSNAISGYEQSESLVAVNTRRAESADVYLELATMQYQEGALGYLDVLDAQRQRFEAELALSAALRDRLVALASLYRVLGGGWLGQS